MAKFLSDVNMKHNEKPNGDSLLDDTDEEEDNNATLVESKHKSKSFKREKEKIDDNGDSGLDNGVQLSE
jgi:hypothetical protein